MEEIKILQLNDEISSGDMTDPSGGAHIIKEIIDVSPIKYDGNKDAYVVCAQPVAQYMLIRGTDLEGGMIHLLLPCSAQSKCSNTYLLADAIQEG